MLLVTTGLIPFMHPHLMHIISFLVTPPQDHHITMVVGMALRAGIGLEENNEIIQRREGGSISM